MEVWLNHDFIAMATAARRQPAGCAAGSAAQDGPQTEQWGLSHQPTGTGYKPLLLVLKGSFPHTRFGSESR